MGQKQYRFVYLLTVWMFIVLFFQIIGKNLDIEIFFVLNLIGFLVLVELTTPFHFKPEWKNRLKWVVLVGVTGFSYIVITKVLAILG